jgi:hypothetical protein
MRQVFVLMSMTVAKECPPQFNRSGTQDERWRALQNAGSKNYLAKAVLIFAPS